MAGSIEKRGENTYRLIVSGGKNLDGSRCRKTKIIDYNSKFGSVINAYISLSGLGRKSFDIPVTFNKGWHGNMKDYKKIKYLLAFVASSIVIFFSVATLCLPKKDYSENEEVLLTLETKLRELYQEQGVCPTCGSDLKEHQIHYLMEH